MMFLLGMVVGAVIIIIMINLFMFAEYYRRNKKR